MPHQPDLAWDIGTAYDFFVSLSVLYNPTTYGLRSAWASGMRQRIPSDERQLLEDFTNTLMPQAPLNWIHRLPEPKDSATAIKALASLSTLDRIWALNETNPEEQDLLAKVTQQGAWQDSDLQDLKQLYQQLYGKKVARKKLTHTLDGWSRALEFGQGIVHALQVYQDVFFSEEEHRILPALHTGLEQAQEKARKLDLYDLLFELSQGVTFDTHNFPQVQTLVLAPSYWITPFVVYSSSPTTVLLFGARPIGDSLVPGETVPEALTNALDAMSEPTRLRILRYLASEAMTPTQLAARLRLRPPTVIHHLRSLRAAGLVNLTSGAKKKEVRYQTRVEGFDAICHLLKDFVLQRDN